MYTFVRRSQIRTDVRPSRRYCNQHKGGRPTGPSFSKPTDCREKNSSITLQVFEVCYYAKAHKACHFMLPHFHQPVFLLCAFRLRLILIIPQSYDTLEPQELRLLPCTFRYGALIIRWLPLSQLSSKIVWRSEEDSDLRGPLRTPAG